MDSHVIKPKKIDEPTVSYRVYEHACDNGQQSEVEGREEEARQEGKEKGEGKREKGKRRMKIRK